MAVHQHGAINSENGYALTLTHTHAIVWPYAANIQSPETFTFALPQPSKRASDPLPLGSLVSHSASSTEPGLVVVIPTSGKITYWESVSSAATLDLRLQRNGVDLSIPGMMSGETVIQILNAETAGFVLAFSTGRIAYMAVRDGQGRPAISVQFLRGGSGTSNGSFFGSLRNVLSSSAWRGDIAAVRAGRHDNKVGERSIVLATTKGKLQSWNIHRGGHADISGDAEAREEIVMAIKAANPALNDLLIEGFEIHDFTYIPKSGVEFQHGDQKGVTQLMLLTISGDAEAREEIVMAIKAANPALNDLLIEGFEIHDFTYIPKSGVEFQHGDQKGVTQLMLLTSLTQRHNSHYFLVSVDLKDTKLSVTDIRPITSYTTPTSPDATSKPRLYLPSPALMAYVVFDRAVVVLSTAKRPESPDNQLRSESHLLPQPFEDVIDFRRDMNIEIVGSGMEEPHGSSQVLDAKSRRFKAKHPAAVLIVRGGGVVRVAATDNIKLISTEAPKIDAISKLKQAVFFGAIKDNPLSFKVRPELEFSAEEVANAAIKLSGEILESKDLANLAVSQSLQKRATLLKDLAIYLKSTGVALDRLTKWQLLGDAEKLAAATNMWKRHDETVRHMPDGAKTSLMSELVEYINENSKNEPSKEKGEVDEVRHWFIKSVPRIQIAIPWAFQVIKYTYQDGQKDHASVMDLLSEADDLVMGAIQSALDFRTSNLDLYGLGSEQLEHGILKFGYEGLPEFWTSTFFIAENLRKQVDLGGMLLREYIGRPIGKGDPSAEVVDKIRLEFPDLIDTAIRSNTERIRWGRAQHSQSDQEQASQMESALGKIQDTHLSSLAVDMDLTDKALALAEKHEILPVLARLLLWDLELRSQQSQQPGLSDEDFESLEARSELMKDSVRQLFVKFGAKWAKALFEHEIEQGLMEQLLDEWKEEQTYLTEFLRSKSEYAKVSWINDITRESDLETASKALLDLGLKHESDLWSKKVELSLGKLALLSTQSYSKPVGILPDENNSELTFASSELGLINIQQQVYSFVLPSIAAAIDENAELQLALEAHSNRKLRKQQMLSKLLSDSMARLIKHEAMNASQLVDLLTLMGTQAATLDQENFINSRFFLALQAVSYGEFSKDEQHLMQRIIWRRCMLNDNWADVNNTTSKDEQQHEEQLRKTSLYQTLYSCFKDRKYSISFLWNLC